MTDFRLIRVYTREKARYEGKPLSHAIVAYLHSLRIAARCVVLRGTEGLYETGEAVSGTIVEGSYDLPIVVDIVLPAAEADAVVERLETMVTDGFVALMGAAITSFKAPTGPLPTHLLVRDIMTREPVAAHSDFSVRSAVELLLDRRLKSLPVIDDRGLPVGIVTQGDLAAKASMPVRLGLLDTLDEDTREGWLRSMEALRISEIMTREPKTVHDDQKAASAVHFMARARMKRMPVVDGKGRLVGVLSRIDVLRALAKHSEPENARDETELTARGGKFVRDLEERDSLALAADTSLQVAVDVLARYKSQRAAVVDAEGGLLGLITDRLLVEAIDSESSKGRVFDRLLGRGRGRAIADIMLRGPVSIGEDATTAEALKLMTERGLKRIPVIGAGGKFSGMLRRDSVLLAMTGNLG